MRTPVLVLCSAVAFSLVSGPASLQGTVGQADPYDVVDNWMQPFARSGYAWGSHPAVFAESPNRIFVIQRGELKLPEPLPDSFSGFYGSTGLSALRGRPEMRNVIFVVDGDGKLVEVWPARARGCALQDLHQLPR